jgi:hypothetical protein
MLRRLDLKGPWRSLDKSFWPDDLPLGCRTVVYGHNGSGKSTLSELLLSAAEGECATEVVWEREDRQRTTVGAGGGSPSPSMAVFTRKWVEANLSDFLDGDSASAIVTLGHSGRTPSRLGPSGTTRHGVAVPHSLFAPFQLYNTCPPAPLSAPIAIFDRVSPNHTAACLALLRSGSSRVSSSATASRAAIRRASWFSGVGHAPATWYALAVGGPTKTISPPDGFFPSWKKGTV